MTETTADEHILRLMRDKRALQIKVVELTRQLEAERRARFWLENGREPAQIMVKLLAEQRRSRNRHREIRKLRIELALARMESDRPRVARGSGSARKTGPNTNRRLKCDQWASAT